MTDARKEYLKSYRSKNKDRLRAARALNYQKNKNLILSKSSEEGSKQRRREAYARRMLDPEYKKKIQSKLKEYRRLNFEKCSQNDTNWMNKNHERYLATKRAWSLKNREIDLESHRRSYHRNKQNLKATRQAYYRNNKEKFREWSRKHRPESRERSRRHYQNNKEKYFEKRHRRRALILSVACDPNGIAEYVKSIKSKKTVRCYYCEQITPTNGCHFDHIIPISRGGAHSIGNLCATCPSCNLSKNDKLPTEWIPPTEQLKLI